MFAQLGVFCGMMVMGLASTSLKAAGFDCAKAKTDIEQIICGHPELSQADTRLGEAYAQIHKLLSNKIVQLKKDQMRWLQKRDHQLSQVCLDQECLANQQTNCLDIACAVQTYHNRIAELETKSTTLAAKIPVVDPALTAITGDYAMGENLSLRDSTFKDRFSPIA